jgi:hypothetical protein
MKLKISPKITKMLTNKTVLTVVTILAVITLIMFLVLGSFNNIMYFIVLAILVRCFSKNMIVVLGIPVVLVNLYALYNKSVNRREGMTGTTPPADSTPASPTTTPSAAAAPAKKTTTTPPVTLPSSDTANIMPGTELPSSSENFRNKKDKYKVDYASTMEDAYDNLNSMIGPDGLRKLTAETKQLMAKQTQLAESMQSMAPMIKELLPMANQAKDLIAGMNGGEGGLDKLMDMAKEMTGKLGNTNV